MADLIPLLPQHDLKLVSAEGPWGGPTYSYRAAHIQCSKGGFVCSLFMNGHPLDRQSFGVAGTITPLVDVWLDDQRLPDHYISAPGYKRREGA
jgi:hypothetical protein